MTEQEALVMFSLSAYQYIAKKEKGKTKDQEQRSGTKWKNNTQW